jgi:hypothetical protein
MTIFKLQYLEFQDGITSENFAEFEKYMHKIPVDIKSLENYIYWLINTANTLKPNQIREQLTQARTILAIARFCEDEHGQGWFYQRPSYSEFGRTYYRGISMQIVHKKLRYAVLGNCHEYDLRACAQTYKLGHAQDVIDHFKLIGTVEEEFAFIIGWIEERDLFVQTLVDDILQFSKIDHNYHAKVVKEMIQMITFGARTKPIKYYDKKGNVQYGSLAKTIKSKDVREQFLDHPLVKGFIKNMNLIDDYLFEVYRDDAKNHSYLMNSSGAVQKSQLTAYLFQQEEQQIMKIVKQIAIQNNHEVMAEIHDAIIFKHKIHNDTLSLINYRIQQATGNPRYLLKYEYQEGKFKRTTSDVVYEQKRHLAAKEGELINLRMIQGQIDQNNLSTKDIYCLLEWYGNLTAYKEIADELKLLSKYDPNYFYDVALPKAPKNHYTYEYKYEYQCDDGTDSDDE